MSEEVFIIFGDSVQRVADDSLFEDVLRDIKATFPKPPLEIGVQLQPRGFENWLLEGTLLIGSNVTVAKFADQRMPWPGKAE
jgi:hypothetical protein